MDTNNRRPTPGGDPPMGTGDWRTQMPADSRAKIVEKIMENLSMKFTPSEGAGLNELRKLAVKFEEKIFATASSQDDYMRKISLKLVSVMKKSANPMSNSLRSNAAGNGQKPSDLASKSMQSQLNSQGPPLPIPVSSNQSQLSGQQLLPRNSPSNMGTTRVQGPASLMTSLPPDCSLSQPTTMLNVDTQNFNMFANNSQEQILASQQQVLSQQSQNSQKYLHQNQLMEQNFQPNQLHSSQQYGMIQRNLPNMNQQQLGPRSSVAGPGLQQQSHQLLGQAQSGSSIMAINHMLQQSKVLQQQTQQNSMSTLLPSQGQQRSNPLQRDVQQRLQAPDSTAQTGNANGGDWQEEIYQKIKAMKDTYFPQLNDLHQRVTAKLQQHDSLVQQSQSQPAYNLERLRAGKGMLERMMETLQMSKSNVQPGMKDKLGSYEQNIINILGLNRPRRIISSLQQPGQLLSSMHHLQPQAQMTQMQQNNPSSPLSGLSSGHQNMLNSLQLSSALGPGQNNSMNSLQQVVDPLQQSPLSGIQQSNVNLVSSQSGMNSLQLNSNMLGNHQLKQQIQHHQTCSNLLQKQSAPLKSNQAPQLHQMADGNDLKITQNLDVKSFAFQQNHHQQLKTGTQSLPASPQIFQNPPPQPTNSPFISPSSSTPFTPSPMPGDSEKVNSGGSTLSNAGSIGHQQTKGSLAPAQSLTIGTPVISASPLLVEFTSQDGNHGNVGIAASGESDVTEQPINLLFNVVKSMSTRALTASVGEIRSVVSLTDRMGGSDPGIGSRGSIGEDLAGVTKSRLQARNFIIKKDGTTGTRRINRDIVVMPSDVVPSAWNVDYSVSLLTDSEMFELDSTETSTVQTPRAEVKHGLLEEIRAINRQLIDTVVEICEEDVDPTTNGAFKEEGGKGGTIIKCSYEAIALSPDMKSHYASGKMSRIQPLRLIVTSNYPNCSPILLDKFPDEGRKDDEDLTTKAMLKFEVSIRSLPEPTSIEEMAKRWDECVRQVILEYAEKRGGGSFSTKYGTWNKRVSAA